jgi:5'-3' exonuclease
VLYTARGISKIQYVDEAFVVEKYGVAPSQYADMATLRGDTSDGLPGVPGIGEKTAASLLRMFGDLDGVIAAVDDPTSSISPRIRASLIASAASICLQHPQWFVSSEICLCPPLLPDRRHRTWHCWKRSVRSSASPTRSSAS